MRKLFIFQTGNGAPDPWDDSISSGNLFINGSLGNKFNPGQYPIRFNFFQKVDSRYVLGPGDTSDLSFSHPLSIPGNRVCIPLNLEDIVLALKGSMVNQVIFGSYVLPNSSQISVSETAGFFTRLEGGAILEHRTNKIVSESINIIPWFFCMKTDEVDLFYITLNSHAVQISSGIDNDYNENRVFTLSNHLKNLNELIFSPSSSRNVRIIDSQIIVKGDSFTITPFDNWFVNTHAKELFENASIKCQTNFEYVKTGNTFKITLNGNIGYLYLRWNTGTNMDKIYKASNNRFFKEYVIHSIKEK